MRVSQILPVLAVALLGALVGVSELITRYKDSPSSVLKLLSAWTYIALNAGASVIALIVVQTLGWQFGGTSPILVSMLQVFIAGSSALLLLRSSLFTVRVGDVPVEVGPSAVLTALLNAADRGIDRVRAVARLRAARRIMADIEYTKSFDALLTYVNASLQNLPETEAKALSTEASTLSSLNMSERQKAIALGLLLLNVTDRRLLREAVTSLNQPTLKDRNPAAQKTGIPSEVASRPERTAS